MNVVGPILHYGRTRSDTAALVKGESVITYGEFADLVLRTASHLTAHGFQRGDRIGLCLRDTSDHLVALLAMAHMGAIAVPLDWRAPPPENARLITGLDLACVLKETTAREVKGYPSIPVDPEWHRAVALADPATGSPSSWHDAFVISATSGSTGTPKLTMICTLPLYYSGGRNSCIAHLLRGDSVILYSSLITPVEFVDVVNSQRITVAVGVPSTVRQLLAASGEGLLLPRSTAFFCTGAPLHPEEKRQAARRLTPLFHERYGTAETLAISVLRPNDLADRSASVGQPHSLAEIEIVDENDRPLPRGVVGLLRFRGPGLGSPLPGSAAEANFRDGWFYPGEIARYDEAGYIFLQGRTSDVIMHRGAKIYPAEIEATLTEHAGVIEAAVLGWGDPDNEEAVIAFVVPQGEIPASELLAHCRMRLTPHKVPRQFHFLDELPKNTAGKIDKTAIAERLVREEL